MLDFDLDWEWANMGDPAEVAKDCEHDDHEWQYVWRDDGDPENEKHILMCMKCRLCMYESKSGSQEYWRVNRKAESPEFSFSAL